MPLSRYGRAEEFTPSGCASSWTPATPAASQGPAVGTYTTTAQDVGQLTYYIVLCDEAGLCSDARAGSFLVAPPGSDGEHTGVTAAGYTRGKRHQFDYFPDKWRPNWETKRWFFAEDFEPRARGSVEAGLTPDVDGEFPNVVAWQNVDVLGSPTLHR